MIATLTLNPSLDLTASLKKIDYKDINRIRGIQKDPGGKGLNISRIIHRLKGDTVALGFAGGDTGKKIRELLNADGVKNRFVRIKGENRSNITVEIRNDPRQIKINEDGPAVNRKEISSLMRCISVLSEGDFLVMSGSIPPGVPQDIYARMINIAHRNKVRTVLDADGEAFYTGLRARPFMIKPNIYEAQRVLEKMNRRPAKICCEKDLFSAASMFVKAGVGTAVISWGHKGIVAASGGKFWRARVPVRLKETRVGAGDAVIAGFVHSLSLGRKIEDCIRWGIACGTASAFEKGTRLCKPEKVRELVGRVKVEQVSF